MGEWKRVETLEDLLSLDDDEVVAGYLDGENPQEPGSDKSRAYWFGWCNRQRDKGRMQSDAIHDRLVNEYVAYRKESMRT